MLKTNKSVLRVFTNFCGKWWPAVLFSSLFSVPFWNIIFSRFCLGLSEFNFLISIGFLYSWFILGTIKLCFDLCYSFTEHPIYENCYRTQETRFSCVRASNHLHPNCPMNSLQAFFLHFFFIIPTFPTNSAPILDLHKQLARRSKKPQIP